MNENLKNFMDGNYIYIYSNSFELDQSMLPNCILQKTIQVIQQVYNTSWFIPCLHMHRTSLM
jgi:hypothetical protein